MIRGNVTALALACALLPFAPAHAGDIAAGKKIASATCIACHGPGGKRTTSPLWPKLAGQNAPYLEKQIKAFRDGDRVEPTMQPMVANLSDDDIENIAAYYASQTPE